MKNLLLFIIFLSNAATLWAGKSGPGDFKKRYPGFEKLFNQCLLSAKNPQSSPVICYPDAKDEPALLDEESRQELLKKRGKRGVEELLREDCEYRYAQKLLQSGFAVDGQSLDWADGVLFSKEAKAPQIYFNAEIPKKYKTSRASEGRPVLVLPEHQWCVGDQQVDKDLKKLHLAYVEYWAGKSKKRGFTKGEILADPGRWMYYLSPRSDCSAMPIEPANWPRLGEEGAAVASSVAAAREENDADPSDAEDGESPPKPAMEKPAFADKAEDLLAAPGNRILVEKLRKVYLGNWIVLHKDYDPPLPVTGGGSFRRYECQEEDGKDCYEVKNKFIFALLDAQNIKNAGLRKGECYKISGINLNNGRPTAYFAPEKVEVDSWGVSTTCPTGMLNNPPPMPPQPAWGFGFGS